METVETVSQHCELLSTGLKPGVNERLFVQSLLHALRLVLAELLSITSEPEADRGKLGVFVTKPGAICSVVKITINLLEE
jgi:hypothetical protein